MNDTTKLLTEVKKGAEMSRRTLPYLIGKTNNTALAEVLRETLREYESISREADEIAATVEGLGTLEALSAEAMIRMNTLSDESAGHLADVTLRGGSMGVVTVADALDKYPDADDNVRRLAERLKTVSGETVSAMQSFLEK